MYKGETYVKRIKVNKKEKEKMMIRSTTSKLVSEGDPCVRSTSIGAEEEVGEVKFRLRLLLRIGVR